MVTAEGAVRDEWLRRTGAEAWRFRWRVELAAEDRFRRLAVGLAEIGAAPELVERARKASEDEARHGRICAEWAASLGAPVGLADPVVAPEIAPRGLALRGRVLYELVAACCVAETESMAVLSTLLEAARGERLRRTLRELAADEVQHSRLGWAHLALEHANGVTAFLAPLVPAMLAGNAEPGLFGPAPEVLDDPALVELGVLPRTLKREIYVRALEDVVFPGLERSGVDAAPARAWLRAQRARERAA